MQQRLLGAILLVALGVIFIPILLDGSGYRARHDRDIVLPPEPQFPPLTQVSPAPVVPTYQKPALAETPPAPEPPVEPRPVELQPAFTLQVATFTREENANALRDKLRRKGYTAYVDSSENNDKTSYRVRIGPELEMARLEQLKAKIRKEEKLDGYIANYP